jgi:metal-responsive CopG/Arc/MetJ family transcriptional regulator
MSTVSSAKKKTGRPPKDSEAVNVRMDRAMLDRVDEFAAGQGIANRPEAVRRLVDRGLGSEREQS